LVDRGDRLIEGGANRSNQARPEEGIHDPVGVSEYGPQRAVRQDSNFPEGHGSIGILLHDDLYRNSRSSNDLKVDRGIARQFSWRCEQQDAYVHGLLVQMARDHKPIPAVVALSATDGHAALNAKRQQKFGGTAAGILHEHDARDSVFLDRPAIELPDLVAAQIHAWDSWRYLLIRSPPPLRIVSTSSRVIQAKSPGIECLMALAATP